MDSLEVEMDLQEEHMKEDEHDGSNKEEREESWKQKSKSSIYQVEIIEGKREKKTVQRLDMQVPKPKEKLKIESLGKGDKLGDIARVNHAIGRLKAPLLKPLHKIIYDRPGAVSSLRKHLRLFNGFQFEIDSEPYNKKREKMARLPKVQLKSICQILDIERSGNQAVLVDRIIQFLVNPTNSGKPVIVKKKRKKKTAKDGKREKKIASKSKKQQIDTGKSKAIVTDSSSDEDDEDEDDEDESECKNKDTEKISGSESRKHKGDKSDSEEEEDDDDDEKDMDSDDLEDQDEETSKSKASNKKKPSPKKTVKKDEDDSDLSVSDDDEDDNESTEEVTFKKTKKKPSPPKRKPAPKTKKADSSSNRKRKDASKSKTKSESSDEDDMPLIKLIKKPPTNEQLQEKIKDLLKTANLEEVTMKQICQQVYDLYPDFDLTNRKDVIKDTVKSLIS